MPYIKYGFMEEIFRSSAHFSDNKLEHIQDFSVRYKSRNYMLGKLIILIHYLLTMFFYGFDQDMYSSMHALYLSVMLITIGVIANQILNDVDEKLTIFMNYPLFLMYMITQITTFLYLCKLGINYYAIIRGLYIQYFVSHLTFMLFFSFNLSHSISIATINLLLISYLQYQLSASLNVDYFYKTDYIVPLIFSGTFMVLHYEFNIISTTLDKYADINDIMLRYIENMLNKMFCLFFTFSKDQIVFSNRSVKNFMMNVFSKSFMEEENKIIGNQFHSN